MTRDKERQKESQKRQRDRNKVHMARYLKEHPCVDCGEGDLRVLTFDHLPEFDKKFDIGRAVSGSTRAWDSILKEIEKCEVVCANCHMKRTGERSGWLKHLMEEGLWEEDPTLFDKRTNHRVEHGGGAKGRRNCKCDPCVEKKKAYDSNWHVENRTRLELLEQA